MMRLRYLTIGCAMLAPLPTATTAGAQASAELRQALLPAPRVLRVKGRPGLVPAGSLAATLTFAPGAVPFDPVATVSAGMGGRPLARRSVNAGAGEWAMALAVTGVVVPAELFKARRAAAARLGPEGYVLESFAGGALAVVVAGGPRGLLYGAQTLAQLLGQQPGRLARVEIEDAPAVAVRELHVHGFDKGYGAGDLKSLTAYTRDLPAFLPSAERGRFNLFRLSLDAGWINHADAWTGAAVDEVMRRAVEECHRHGLDILMEVRFATPIPGARVGEAQFTSLDPLTDLGAYDRALRRALSWGPDAIDVSMNDLGPVEFHGVRERYGEDARFSGQLMAELLRRAQAVIAEEKPGTPLHALPRFYGAVHWEQHSTALPEFWRNAPPGVVMYTTTPLSHPLVREMRDRYSARFMLWTNYTSNHGKELRILLTNTPPDLAQVQQLPLGERRVLINLGYPVGPQRSVATAMGEALWNPEAYRTLDALAKAARLTWGKWPAKAFLHYARLLDPGVMMGSRGGEAAALLTDSAAPAGEVERWRGYVGRAREAEEAARKLESSVRDPGLARDAEVLYWNARRVELDARVGLEIAVARAAERPVDAAVIRALLAEHERILAAHYPVEHNDPKSAEVVTRGIRQIRAALKEEGKRPVPVR